MGTRTARATLAIGIVTALLSAGAADGHTTTPTVASEPGPPGGIVAVAVVEKQGTEGGQSCYEAEGTHHAKTLIGATFYRFTHRTAWCTDGTNVVSVDNRRHKMTDVDAFATFRGMVEDYVSRVPAAEVTSIMKGHVDNCVPIEGCLSSKYPFVELTLRADGTWYATTGESESS